MGARVWGGVLWWGCRRVVDKPDVAGSITVIHVLENSRIVLEDTPAVGACGGPGHRGCGR